MRLGSWLFLATGALVACNAILGVDDVRLRQTKKGTPEDDGGTDPIPDVDGSGPRIDRGALALGYLHTCARLPTNGVVCWGTNGAGQLGDAVPLDSGAFVEQALKPIEVPGVDGVTDITAGLSHTCVLQRQGDVRCWGLNSFGQLGGGTTAANSSSPVIVKDLTGVQSLAGGQSFTCAVMTDKTVKCWGANYSGQLGDGTKTTRATVAPVKDLAGVVSVSGATDHACAVLEGGNVACWGGNVTGQLGNGTTNESLTPNTLTTIKDVAQIAAASKFTCARQTTGRVYCWGSNEYGQLGTGSTSAAANPSPNVVTGLTDATWIWTGYEHACAVRRAGTVTCWGKAETGQIGSGNTADAAPKPLPVTGITGVRAVWTGGDRSCALLDEGRAYCWGANSQGQLGNGTDVPSPTPVPVSNFP